MNFRGIIDQGFDKGALSETMAAPRPSNKLEKSITYYVVSMHGTEEGERRERERGKGDVSTLHCHVIGDGVTVLGRVDAFLIVRYVSTLRRARVACAHAFMHRIITRR